MTHRKASALNIVSRLHKNQLKDHIMNTFKKKTKNLTCTGWNPQLRRSFCQFSVYLVPDCEHLPRHTASAYTLSAHSPTLSPSTSAPPPSPSGKQSKAKLCKRNNNAVHKNVNLKNPTGIDTESTRLRCSNQLSGCVFPLTVFVQKTT